LIFSAVRKGLIKAVVIFKKNAGSGKLFAAIQIVALAIYFELTSLPLCY
jgi:hypothetical protein